MSGERSSPSGYLLVLTSDILRLRPYASCVPRLRHEHVLEDASDPARIRHGDDAAAMACLRAIEVSSEVSAEISGTPRRTCTGSRRGQSQGQVVFGLFRVVLSSFLSRVSAVWLVCSLSTAVTRDRLVGAPKKIAKIAKTRLKCVGGLRPLVPSTVTEKYFFRLWIDLSRRRRTLHG